MAAKDDNFRSNAQAAEPWSNKLTFECAFWLTRPDQYDKVRQLVHEWNVRKLLGIDLADQLKRLVEEKATQVDPDASEALASVNWGQIAEALALRFEGVDTAELERRRHSLLRTMLH